MTLNKMTNDKTNDLRLMNYESDKTEIDKIRFSWLTYYRISIQFVSEYVLQDGSFIFKKVSLW